MQHIVISEIVKCPKCEKDHSGACVQVFEMIVCVDCFYKKYENEMVPILKEMVRKYFQPERLSEKTPKGEAIV